MKKPIHAAGATGKRAAVSSTMRIVGETAASKERDASLYAKYQTLQGAEKRAFLRANKAALSAHSQREAFQSNKR